MTLKITSKRARYFHKVSHSPHCPTSLSQFNGQWVRFVRVMGCYPLSLVKPRVQDPCLPVGALHFQYRTLSWATLYSVVTISLSLAYLLFWMYSLHFGDGIQTLFQAYERHILNHTATSSRVSLDPMTRICTQLINGFVPVTAVGYLASCLASTPSFICFLNGASYFESQVRRLFPGVVPISLVHLHRFGSHVMIANWLIFFTFLSWHLPTVWMIINRGNALVTYHILMAFGVLGLISLHGVFGDTAAVMCLKLCEEYYLQLIDGIYRYRKKKGGGGGGVQLYREWRSLVHFTRRQTRLVSRILEGSTSSVLLGLHVVLTAGTYLLYCALNKNEFNSIITHYAHASLVFCAVTYLRLYLKAVLAENMTKRENELAEMLRVVKDRPRDTKYATAQAALHAGIQIELSFITDPIVSQPSRCVLNKSITLQVALLLGIFRNVSTYVVALIQLDNVQKSLVTTTA